MSTDYQPTYWMHPESDSFFICYDKLEEEKMMDEDGLCVQLDTELQYCTKRIELIDNDPEHTLPQDIIGVIKLAAWHHKDQSVGGAIYYDQRKRFPDGGLITIPNAKREPGGIVTSQTGDRYLCEFVQELDRRG